MQDQLSRSRLRQVCMLMLTLFPLHIRHSAQPRLHDEVGATQSRCLNGYRADARSELRSCTNDLLTTWTCVQHPVSFEILIDELLGSASADGSTERRHQPYTSHLMYMRPADYHIHNQ
nr:hypothetical protein CFP56_54453 [Quercus suber]